MKHKVVDIKENKIREFNYKFLNKIGGCGYLVGKWNSNISVDCEICGKPDTQLHILFQCPLVSDIWNELSTIIQSNISESEIVFGIKDNRPLNNLISQIAYSIHKCWIIRTNEKIKYNEFQVRSVIKSDLLYKSKVFHLLKENQLKDIFQNVSVILFPHR